MYPSDENLKIAIGHVAAAVEQLRLAERALAPRPGFFSEMSADIDWVAGKAENELERLQRLQKQRTTAC